MLLFDLHPMGIPAGEASVFRMLGKYFPRDLQPVLPCPWRPGASQRATAGGPGAAAGVPVSRAPKPVLAEVTKLTVLCYSIWIFLAIYDTDSD